MTDAEVLQAAVVVVTRFTAHAPVAVRAVFAARPNTVGEILAAAKLDAKGVPAGDAGPKVEAAFEAARAEIAKDKASIAAADDQPEPGAGE